MIGVSPTEEIKARLDIAEFIRGYLRLEKAGVNFRALCPFHAEKTPSFFVSPARQTWHCFGGCGEGGDIFAFAMKMEGLDFPEALRLLAGRAGVVLAREDPRARSERRRLYDICEAAAEIFERRLLLTPEPKEYLKSRGVEEGSVRSFRIGFAPAGWRFLVPALERKGFRPEEAERAGLAIRSDKDGSHYDRFRGRIMFPVNDANGRVVGFGGRVFQSEIRNQKSEIAEAKYINTPQTPIYDKSRTLYGFDKAKSEIRTQNRAVAVEGYMDCVMSHQAGVPHTIAVSGTALTAQHLTTLRRLCDTLVCSFDADAAGDSATRRSLALGAQFGFARLIASIPSGKDPADTVRASPEEWRLAVEHARPIMDFYFDKALREQDPSSADGKKKIAELILPLIREIPDEIQKSHWVMLLASRLKVPEQAVRNDLDPIVRGQGVSGASVASAENGAPAPFSRRALLEERMLALLALSPEDTGKNEFGEGGIDFTSDANQRLFAVLISDASSPADLMPLLEQARFRGEILRERVADIRGELALCRRELMALCLRERLREIGGKIEEKERERDQEAVSALLKDHLTTSERLHVLT